MELFHSLRSAPKPLLIHCHYGKDRTGAAVILYRMRQKQVSSFEEAYQEAGRHGFGRFDFGLRDTINRYRDPAKLALLPSPDTAAS